jgi:hypothetical protein
VPGYLGSHRISSRIHSHPAHAPYTPHCALAHTHPHTSSHLSHLCTPPHTFGPPRLDSTRKNVEMAHRRLQRQLLQDAVAGGQRCCCGCGGCSSRRFAALQPGGAGEGLEPRDRGCCCHGDAGWRRDHCGACSPAPLPTSDLVAALPPPPQQART